MWGNGIENNKAALVEGGFFSVNGGGGNELEGNGFSRATISAISLIKLKNHFGVATILMFSVFLLYKISGHPLLMKNARLELQELIVE